MFKFLAFLLLIGVLGFLILGVFLGRVVRFFGSSNNKKGNQRRSTRGQSSRSEQANVPQKKFAKEEGEYVNYEEVRDED